MIQWHDVIRNSLKNKHWSALVYGCSLAYSALCTEIEEVWDILMKQCVQTQIRDKSGRARKKRDNWASRERSQFSRNTPLKIGTVPANPGRMVTLRKVASFLFVFRSCRFQSPCRVASFLFVFRSCRFQLSRRVAFFYLFSEVVGFNCHAE